MKAKEKETTIKNETMNHKISFSSRYLDNGRNCTETESLANAIRNPQKKRKSDTIFTGQTS